MALIWADKVAETTTTTGTGDITLAAAITGYRRFSTVCATSDTCYYSITAVDVNGVPTGDWEVGLGTYSASNTLTRTTVFDSSNAGAAVNFAAGTKRVSLSVVAQKLKFRGALVKKSADQTGVDLTSATNLGWNSEIYDTDNIHDNSTNNNRLTVPAGVSKVRVGGTLQLANCAANNTISCRLTKNGVSDYDGFTGMQTESSFTTPRCAFSSGVIPVAAGDYFSMLVQLESDTSVDITAAQSNFWMEIIE